MSKKEKISLPPSGGGIFRTYDDEGLGLKIKPKHFIIVVALVIIFELFLHLYGRALY